MARKELTYTVKTKGRDQGRRYFIKEMPASQAEFWVYQLFGELVRAGIQVPSEFAAMGMAGLAKMVTSGAELAFLFSQIEMERAKPLLLALADCVQFMPDDRHDEIKLPVDDDNAEETNTRATLKWEAFKLHIAFLTADK